MVLGLTGGETILLVVGLVFIVFALVVSMVIPRLRPGFPGDRVGWFVFVSLVLFAVMAATVVTTAGGEEHEGSESEAAETQPGETEPEPGQVGAEPEGDAAAGEQVFASAGCGGCHTLSAAGASGAVGPNLDESQPSFDLAVDRVTNGKGAMPSFEGRLDEEQIRNVAAYVSENAGG